MSEKLQPHSCERDKEASLPIHKKLRNSLRYFKPRKIIGRWILGNPRYGQGILMQVDLAYKTKEQVDAFWKALEYLRKAGISFDTGCGCKFDMELDWSLKGATVLCKKCGYKSEENRKWLDYWDEKEHFIRPCDKCGENIDSDDGYWHIKPHFWSKTKYYHTKCHDSNCNCQKGGACSECRNG